MRSNASRCVRKPGDGRDQGKQGLWRQRAGGGGWARVVVVNAGIVFVLTLAACSTPTKSTLEQSGIDVPDEWASSRAKDDEAAVTMPLGDAWFADVGTPELNALIDEAMTNNFDLKRAWERVQAAEARARVTGARLLKPRIDGAGSATRESIRPKDSQRLTTNEFDAAVDASWDIDVWGRLSDETRASVLDFRAAAEDYYAARLSLAADVARAWFNAVEANLQVALAEETVRNFRNNLSVVESKFGRGLTSALDVRLERTNLAGAESRVQARRRTRNSAVRLLETLLGRYPAAKLQVPSELIAPSADVPAELPAQMLERRPDIQAAARRLAAADARLDAARKNWLPSVVLRARGGFRETSVDDLVGGNAWLWRLASELAIPIFRGGGLKAERDAAQANVSEALSTYAQTVLTAFREVEIALDSEDLLETQEEALRIAAIESEAGASLARQRYQDGLLDILTWLEARNRVFDAKSALYRTSNERLQNRVDLYLSLGGGFGSAGFSQRAVGAAP